MSAQRKRFLKLIGFNEEKDDSIMEPEYSIEGKVVAEENFVQSVLGSRIQSINNAQEDTQRLSNQIDIIKKIAGVIREERGIAVESANILIDGMYKLAGLTSSGERMVATEAYHQNLVATESIGTFLRKVWDGIKKFILGFLKFLRDFFYTIAGIDVPVSKRKMALKEQLNHIKKHNLTIDVDKAKMIDTRLPDMLNMNNPEDATQDMITEGSRGMMNNYDFYFNKLAMPMVKQMKEKFIPAINSTLEELKTEVRTDKDVENLFQVFLGIVNESNSLRKLFVSYECELKDLPDQVRTKLEENLNDSPLKYTVLSAFDIGANKTWLCRELNVYAIYHKQLEGIRDLNDIQKPNIEFYYSNFLKAKEDVVVSRVAPVSHIRDLENIYNDYVSASSKLDFKSILRQVDDTAKLLDRTITNVSKNIGMRIEAADEAISGDYDYDQVLEAMMASVHRRYGMLDMDQYIPILRDTAIQYCSEVGEDLPSWVGELNESSPIINVLISMGMNVASYHASSAKREFSSELRFLKGYASWVIHNETIANMYELKAVSGPEGITPSTRDSYANLPDIIDTVLRKSFLSLQTLLNASTVEASKTYREFEVELMNYLNASAEQYR